MPQKACHADYHTYFRKPCMESKNKEIDILGCIVEFNNYIFENANLATSRRREKIMKVVEENDLIYLQWFICDSWRRPEYSNRLGCLRGPWTVIYGSVVDVIMDWAYRAYPSQVWSPIPGMDMLHGSLSEQHNTSSQ